MAHPTGIHDELHSALSTALESYHQQLAEIDAEEQNLSQRRAIVKTIANADIVSKVNELKISPDLVTNMVAACW